MESKLELEANGDGPCVDDGTEEETVPPHQRACRLIFCNRCTTSFDHDAEEVVTLDCASRALQPPSGSNRLAIAARVAPSATR